MPKYRRTPNRIRFIAIVASKLCIGLSACWAPADDLPLQPDETEQHVCEALKILFESNPPEQSLLDRVAQLQAIEETCGLPVAESLGDYADPAVIEWRKGR